MKAVPFFTDDIKIIPHTATHRAHLDRPVSIAEFSQGLRVSLYEQQNGDLLARMPNGVFIEGPEAKDDVV